MEDPTCHRAVKPVGTTEPVLRARELQLLRPTRPRTRARRVALLTTTREKPVQQRRPSTAKNKILNK